MSDSPKEGYGGGIRLSNVKNAIIRDCHFEDNRVDIDATDSSVRVSDSTFVSKPEKQKRASKGWTPGFRMPWLDKKED